MDKFGLRVQTVDENLAMDAWGDEECRRVGCALATFIRKRKEGASAVEAWKNHYKKVSEKDNEARSVEREVRSAKCEASEP